MAGRMARAFTVESPGVYRPEWTIEQVAKDIEAIRNSEEPLVFPPVPSGHIDHLRYSFGMAETD